MTDESNLKSRLLQQPHRVDEMQPAQLSEGLGILYRAVGQPVLLVCILHQQHSRGREAQLCQRLLQAAAVVHPSRMGGG